jgi:hypothetical protein
VVPVEKVWEIMVLALDGMMGLMGIKLPGIVDQDNIVIAYGTNLPSTLADGWKNYSVRRQKGAKQRSRSTNFAREIETRLADEAWRQGISVDALLERLIIINERAALTPPAQCNPELPVWHFGGAGALHRAGYLRRCPLNLVSSTQMFWSQPENYLTLQAFFVK